MLLSATEYTANAVFVAFLQLLPLGGKKNFILFNQKRKIVLYFKISTQTNYHPFQNLSLEFILKMFLKFRKFQRRCSYNKNRKSVVILFTDIRALGFTIRDIYITFPATVY